MRFGKKKKKPVKEENVIEPSAKKNDSSGIVNLSSFSNLKKRMILTFVKALDPKATEEKEQIKFDTRYEKEVKKYVNML